MYQLETRFARIILLVGYDVYGDNTVIYVDLIALPIRSPHRSHRYDNEKNLYFRTVWKNCLGFSVGYQRAPGWFKCGKIVLVLV